MTKTMTKKTRYVDSPDTEALLAMLGTMRPGGSAAEEAFIRRWIEPLGTYADGFGNHIIRIGTDPVMWSSHTDTVHLREGSQRIKHSGGWIGLHPLEKTATCLGADCSAGVFLMSEMILARRPGLYVFHREEESGGHGSQWIADNTPELVDGIVACIALDRKGTDSVITHQYGGRCASDAFALSMAKQLKGFKADSGGSFTDSANYTHLIPECTNISVGYESAHGVDEKLNLFHLLGLRDMLMRFDISRVDIRRDPTPKVKALPRGSYGAWNLLDDDSDWTGPHSNRTARTVTEFCRLYPEEVADLLGQYGISIDELYGSTPWLD